MRGYHARRAARQAKALARDRLRAVAVDGKTSRGARRADGTRVHLLGVAEHGGHLLDHLEVDVKHNETSHFTELLDPLDLDGAVVTFDALHTVRANVDWLVSQKNAPCWGRAKALLCIRRALQRLRSRAAWSCGLWPMAVGRASCGEGRARRSRRRPWQLAIRPHAASVAARGTTRSFA